MAQWLAQDAYTIEVMGSNPVESTNDSVAQQVEQYTFNVWVASSNLAGITLLEYSSVG